MRITFVPTLLVCLYALLIAAPAGVCVPGRFGVVSEAKAGQLRLQRENPDGWFSMLIPTDVGKVERHADVDGGFYRTEELEIDYDYWTYENTPNFLRDANGNYPKGPLLACSSKSRHTQTSWTRIDGKRALIQSCTDTDERRDFHYIYHVTFHNIKVYDGEGMSNGMFNLTIRYKSRRYLPASERIVRSLDFKSRVAGRQN